MTGILLADIPPDERPRERMLRLGADALSDAELIALLLGSGRRGIGVLDCARDLLAAHGGLSGLAGQDSITLTALPGVGPAKATRVVAALALARRFGTSTDRRRTLRTPADIRRVVAPVLAETAEDQLVVLVADRANRLLGVLPVPGALAHRTPHPVPEVLSEVLRRGAVTFALAHRHASDRVSPAVCRTQDHTDAAFTSAVAVAAQQCGLRLLDHVVLTGHRWSAVPLPEDTDAEVAAG